MKKLLTIATLVILLANGCQSKVGGNRELIGTSEECELKYTKDKKFVYLEDQKISKADPETFKLAGNGFFSLDKDTVFRLSRTKYCQLSAEIVTEADPESFQDLGGYFFRNQNQIYYAAIGPNQKIPQADNESFSVLYNDYAKDNKHVYYGSEVINDADPVSFQVLDIIYTKDKNFVYEYGRKIPGANPQTFQLP